MSNEKRYIVVKRDRGTTLHMVIDGKLGMDVYHWFGPLGEEQCKAVAAALEEVHNKHPHTW